MAVVYLTVQTYEWFLKREKREKHRKDQDLKAKTFYSRSVLHCVTLNVTRSSIRNDLQYAEFPAAP